MTTDLAFPPLTPLAEYPLHGWDYGEQYACKRPEDPGCMVFDWRCHACVYAAQAHVMRIGDEPVWWRQDANTDERSVPLSWLVERSICWLTETGLWL